jgi:hypothetical protein
MLGAAIDVYKRTRKKNDQVFNAYVMRPLAAAVVAVVAKTPVTPNQLTLLNLFIFVGAAIVFVLMPTFAGALIGVAVLELSYMFDCADGMLARHKQLASKEGHLFDFFTDEAKAVLLAGSLGVRLWRTGGYGISLQGVELWAPGDARFLLLAVAAVVIVSSGLSLTNFVRHPVMAGKETAVESHYANAEPKLLSPMTFLRFLNHYPSHVYVWAIVGRLDAFLWMYVALNALYLAKGWLGLALKFGRGLGIAHRLHAARGLGVELGEIRPPGELPRREPLALLDPAHQQGRANHAGRQQHELHARHQEHARERQAEPEHLALVRKDPGEPVAQAHVADAERVVEQVPADEDRREQQLDGQDHPARARHEDLDGGQHDHDRHADEADARAAERAPGVEGERRLRAGGQTELFLGDADQAIEGRGRDRLREEGAAEQGHDEHHERRDDLEQRLAHRPVPGLGRPDGVPHEPRHEGERHDGQAHHDDRRDDHRHGGEDPRARRDHDHP